MFLCYAGNPLLNLGVQLVTSRGDIKGDPSRHHVSDIMNFGFHVQVCLIEAKICGLQTDKICLLVSNIFTISADRLFPPYFYCI